MKKAPPKDPYKIVLLGERGVGKATIIKKFTEGFPQDESVSSLTTQNLRRTIEIPNGPKVTLDLYKSQVFDPITTITTKNSCEGAHAVVLVFDITKKDTFEKIKDYWLKEAEKYTKEDTIIALAGNKIDLYEELIFDAKDPEKDSEERKKYRSSIELYARTSAHIYEEISANSIATLEGFFEKVARKIYDPEYNFYQEEDDKRKAYAAKKQQEKEKEVPPEKKLYTLNNVKKDEKKDDKKGSKKDDKKKGK